VSSATVEDCEAYKDFLAQPSPAFTGPKRPRTSGRWRPFTGTLSADSQAYAVRVLRAAFRWLVEVRYLAGNPWHAVHDPATVTQELRVQVDRALPATLWTQLRHALDHASSEATVETEARQWRVARAAILLMGDSGVRRSEAAQATREQLHPADSRVNLRAGAAGGSAGETASDTAQIWTLTLVGKRRRQRTVPVSPDTVTALRAHWRDRGRDFDGPDAHGPLVAPLVVPATHNARRRHMDGNEMPYAVDALGRLVRTAVKRLGEHGTFSADDLAQLATTSAHAFRHTFGTQAIKQMPPNVVQSILGHTSLQTTSIYTRAERRQMLDAAERFYSAD
jgi:integrase